MLSFQVAETYGFFRIKLFAMEIELAVETPEFIGANKSSSLIT